MAKYTDEMVNGLNIFMSKYDGEIPYEDVETLTTEFNETFEVDYSVRSLASKLRHMGATVGKKTPVTHQKSYTPEEEAKIRELAAKDGVWLEDIADALGREVKSIGGKLISMGIYGIKKRNRKEAPPKLFNEADESIICEMVKAEECFIEDIAEKLGKDIKQVRGKLASMRIKGVKQRNSNSKAKPKIYTEEVVAEIKAELDAGKALEDIAAERGLNPRGMLTTLTRLGVLQKKSKKVFWTDERKEKLAALANEGNTLEEIADALGTTIMVVGKQAKAMGLEIVKPEDE